MHALGEIGRRTGPIGHGTQHGGVHQNINLAGRVERLLEQLQNGRLAGLVVLQTGDIQAGLTEDLRLGAKIVEIAAGHEGVNARLGQGLGNLAAEKPGAPGDDGHTPPQIK